MIRGSTPAWPVGDQPPQRRQPLPLGEGTIGQHDPRGGVVDARGVAGRDRPVRGESGTQLCHIVGSDAGPHLLVDGEVSGAFPGGHLDGQDLLGEVAGVDGGGRPAVAGDGQLILVVPGHAIISSHVLRGDAHVAAVERVGQRADHGVDDGAVAHPLAPPQPGHPVLAAAHRLRPASHRDLGIAQRDGLRRGHDRLQAAAAEPVHGERRRLHRQAAIDRGHPAEVHVPWLGVDHVAEDAVADGRGLHLCSADSFGHHRSGKITRRNASEAATVFSDRGTGPGQDEEISGRVHHRLLTCPGRR